MGKWPPVIEPPTKPSLTIEHKDSNKRHQVWRYLILAALYPHVLRLMQLWLLASGCGKEITLRFAALLNNALWQVLSRLTTLYRTELLLRSNTTRYQNEKVEPKTLTVSGPYPKSYVTPFLEIRATLCFSDIYFREV